MWALDFEAPRFREAAPTRSSKFDKNSKSPSTTIPTSIVHLLDQNKVHQLEMVQKEQPHVGLEPTASR
jgi:hypothetical protein